MQPFLSVCSEWGPSLAFCDILLVSYTDILLVTFFFLTSLLCPGVQQLLGNQVPVNICWLTGTANPAAGITMMGTICHLCCPSRLYFLLSVCSKFLFLEFPPLRLTSCLVLLFRPCACGVLITVAIEGPFPLWLVPTACPRAPMP